MKRINMHLENDTVVKLDKIVEKIRQKSSWSYRSITRADLIRLAISELFKIKYPYIHTSSEALLDTIKELKLKWPT